MENVKESKKNKGVAFEVILRPAASADGPPSSIQHPASPTKDRPLSQSDIERKLKEAEERRLSVEASKLQSVTKDKERLQEVNQKAQELNEAFAKEAEKKLTEKMDASEEKKKAQELAKQERLKQHGRHVEEVRRKRQSQPSENQELQTGSSSTEPPPADDSS